MKKRTVIVILVILLLFILKSCDFFTSERKTEPQIIAIPVLIKKQSKNINAAQIDLKYSKENLELEKIERNNSFFKYVLEDKSYDWDGWIRLSGGLPYPGIAGEDLEIATFYFRYSGFGKLSVKLMPSSLVLLNDGLASSVAGTLGTVEQDKHGLILGTFKNERFKTTEMILGASWQK